MPATVRVGFRVYRIELRDQLEMDPGQLGTHSALAARIVLSRQQSAIEAAQTLLHELLHAVASVFGDPEWKEEPVVTLFAAGLATVMQANPDVFAWITRNLEVKA